jgi:PAS domain-containing protein
MKRLSTHDAVMGAWKTFPRKTWGDFIKEAVVLDQLPCGILLSDVRGKFLWVSEFCAMKLGYAQKQLCLQANIFDVASTESYQALSELIAELESGASQVPWYSVTFLSADHTRITGQATSTKVDLDGLPLVLTVALFDEEFSQMNQTPPVQMELF